MEEVARRAFAAYGYPDVQLKPAQSGYRNTSYAARVSDDSMLNIIIYKNEAGIKKRIKNANFVGDFLAANGLPCRSTKDSRILSLKSATATRFASLYTYLPGKTIPWEAYTKHHIKLLGMALANIHRTSVALDSSGMICVTDEYTAILENEKLYFRQEGVQNALASKLGLSIALDTNTYKKLLEDLAKIPGQQTLHMDFVRGNVLFGQKTNGSKFVDGSVQLTGIIDFEKVSYGHPVFDIARTLAFLYVDCKYKAADKIEKYFLRSGYSKRGQKSVPRIIGKDGSDVLHELTTMFLMYDFYKFLKHNPYESLESNEHYVRTRDILVARKVLITV